MPPSFPELNYNFRAALMMYTQTLIFTPVKSNSKVRESKSVSHFLHNVPVNAKRVKYGNTKHPWYFSVQEGMYNQIAEMDLKRYLSSISINISSQSYCFSSVTSRSSKSKLLIQKFSGNLGNTAKSSRC